MAIENKKKRNMLSFLNDSHFVIECLEAMLLISDSPSLESLSTCELTLSPFEILGDLTHNCSLTADCRSKISMSGEFKYTIMRSSEAGGSSEARCSVPWR